MSNFRKFFGEKPPEEQAKPQPPIQETPPQTKKPTETQPIVPEIIEETRERLQSIETVYPNLEMLDPDDKSVHEDRIPAVATQQDWLAFEDKKAGDESELIWLTADAAKERLETLLLTHPDFNERAFSHTAGSDALEMLEQAHGGRRVPKSWEEILETLHDRGFDIVRDKEGKEGIVIDATIPRKDNTSGRIVKQKVKEHGPAVLSMWVPEEPEKSGIRPATADSTHGIFVPLEWIQYTYPIAFKEKWGGLRTHPRLSPDVGTHHFTYPARTVQNALLELYDREDEIGNELRTIFDKEKIRREDGVTQSRIEFYHFLTERLGFNARAANTGYFPAEPVFKFVEGPLQRKERKLVDYFTEINAHYDKQPDRRQTRDVDIDPFTVYLQEIWHWLNFNKDRKRS